MAEALDLSIFVRHGDGGLAHIDLAVEGVGCAGCIRKIEGGLKQLPGVVDARLNFTNRRLTVDWRDAELQAGEVIGALARIGYRAHPFEVERAESDEAKHARWLMKCLAVAGFAAMNIMLLSVSVWSGSDMSQETRDFFHWLSALIALPAVAYAGQPFFQSALRALRSRQLNMDVPISLGVLLALGMSVIETANHAQHAYFDSAVMLLFFLLCGRYVDHAVRRKTRAVAGNLAALKAEVAHRFERGGEVVMVPVAALKPDDRLLVRPGERVPADGVVISGVSEIDESLITGETVHRKVAPNAQIYGGSVNYSGALTMRVTAAGAGSLIDEVERLLDKAAAIEIALSAARRPRGAALCADGARHRGADRHRLADRRRVVARRHRHGDRGADHHLSVRVGAGDSGRAGGGVGRAVPLRHDPQQRRRHRAAGRGRYGDLRQDRNADAAGSARGQRRCRRRRPAGAGRAARIVQPPSAGAGGRARGARPDALRGRRRGAGRGRARHARWQRGAAWQSGILRHRRANRERRSRRVGHRVLACRPFGRAADPPAAASGCGPGGDGAAAARARDHDPVGRPQGGGGADRHDARHSRTGPAA